MLPKTMLSLSSTAEAIYSELATSLESITMRWKASDDLSEYREAKPSVHLFTYDTPDDAIPSPSVLVQVTSLAQGMAHFVIYVHVTHPAIMDKEIVHPVERGVFTYGEGDAFTSDGVRTELYKATLMLGEAVYTEMSRLGKSGYAVSAVSLTPPDSIMASFPYCSCVIECDVRIAQEMSTNKSRLMELL